MLHQGMDYPVEALHISTMEQALAAVLHLADHVLAPLVLRVFFCKRFNQLQQILSLS